MFVLFKETTTIARFFRFSYLFSLMYGTEDIIIIPNQEPISRVVRIIQRGINEGLV